MGSSGQLWAVIDVVQSPVATDKMQSRFYTLQRVADIAILIRGKENMLTRFSIELVSPPLMLC